MPITAEFLADWTQFLASTKKAEDALKSVDDTSKDFGAEFIKRADLAGGRLMDLGSKGEQAAPRMGALTSELKKVDSALASMGVHIGPQVKALDEIAGAAGKTVKQFGLLASAGAAVGVGLAAVQLGRWIADVTGADKAVQGLVEQLMGWGSSAEAAAAKQDVLNRATAQAGKPITDYAEAIRITRKTADDFILVQGRSADAARDGAVQVSAWRKEIALVKSHGDLDALKQDLESQNFTLQELSKRYGIHVEALQYLNRETAKAAGLQEQLNKAQENADEATKKAAAAERAMWNEIGVLQMEAAYAAQQALEKQEADLRAYYDWVGERRMEDDAAAAASAAKKAALADAEGQALMDAAIKEHEMRVAAAKAGEAAGTLGEKSNDAAGGIQNMASAAEAARGSFFAMSAELYNSIRAAQALDDLVGRDRGIYGSTIGGISGSNPSMRWGQASTIVNINGSVLANKNEIARVVGDAVTSSYRQGGNRLG